MLSLGAYKPLLSVFILPPVPFLCLILVGARLMWARRSWVGWLLLLSGVGGVWLSTCVGMGQLLAQVLLREPPALSAQAITALQNAPARTVIVVLGGGVDDWAPEYQGASLQYPSLERLRYGVWLSRQTGVPLAFSGGAGWGQPGSPPEAQVAAKMAAQEWGLPIKWLEDRSRDTRENAAYTTALLQQAGIERIVLVTHGHHMPRALSAFTAAAHGQFTIEPAPMGLAKRPWSQLLTWLPSPRGLIEVHSVWHEWLGAKLQ